MRFWPKKGNRVLVVGIFQSAGAGRAVLQNLHRARFRRVAAIYASAKGRQRVEEHGISAIGGSAVALILSVVLGSFIFWALGMLGNNPRAGVALPLAAFAFGGAITGWILVQLFREHVDSASFARFTNTILPNEMVVLAEVEASEASRVLTILRGVEAEAPVTFGFYPPPPFSIDPSARPLSHELSSSQRLVEKAASLANAITVSRAAKPRGQSFLHRLLEIENALEWANMSLTMSAEAHHAFTLSAEWLLDNAYLIREQVADLRKSLPQKQYGKLPLIASGPGAGLPRVYQVAAEMVTETDGALEPEIVRRFLSAFQAITPLDIGELWALPLMLRLQLLECIRTLAIQVDQQQRESEEADFWANRLITAVRHSSPRLLKIMEELVERYPEPTPHFASELVAHLYDDEGALPVVSGWLERSLRSPLLEVMQQEHRHQAVQQTALTNAINSCRRLAQIQWRELFQSTSWAESELATDPAGVYARMDFDTRDRCRSAVEEIARWSKCSEQTIIHQSLALAKDAQDEVARHVGYYLIDAGRTVLEQAIGARVPLAERSRRWLRAHATGAYFGSLLLLTTALVAAPLLFVSGLVSSPTLLLLGLLLLAPASELAVLVVNYLVTSFLPPQALPKMFFEKEGIPDDCRTLVVVPMLLTTPSAIQNQLSRLEIHYLGNTDPNLRFSLLSDFSDAPQQSMPEDAEYIDIVARGVEELNRRHGAGRFFLFHRGRIWSESEQRWIGWERKRGKLEQLNQFLVGEPASELEGFLHVGDRAQLEGIRFVITLDADTQLLRDTARRMIETLAHPLNQARLSPDGRHVFRGYTIIQPSVIRAGSTLTHTRSQTFTRICLEKAVITAKAFTSCGRFTASYQGDFQRRTC
jgi:cyclic beta-1,2-glucan synthetase